MRQGEFGRRRMEKKMNSDMGLILCFWKSDLGVRGLEIN